MATVSAGMNVLHVHSGNMFGGVERMLETLAPATAGVAPIRSAFALCFGGRVGDTLRAAGAEVHQLGPVHARRPGEVRQARRALQPLLESQPWTAVFVHSAWSQAIFGPTILNGGATLVRWVHAPGPGPAWLEFWASRSRPHLALCNSNYTRLAAQARLGDIPVAVCYPPAPSPAADEKARVDVRSELGTPPGRVVIVIAARMEPWKGHELLLESLSMLPRTGWEVWVAGGAQQAAERRYFEALVARARAAGFSQQVRFLGERPDVGRLLQAADIYCQPNLSAEPFGLAFVEALAAGLPVVTTKLGAAPEIVDDRCGVLVDAGSADGVATALRGLIEHEAARHAMGAAARLRARTFCDLSQSLPRLAAVLSRAAQPTPVLT